MLRGIQGGRGRSGSGKFSSSEAVIPAPAGCRHKHVPGGFPHRWQSLQRALGLLHIRDPWCQASSCVGCYSMKKELCHSGPCVCSSHLRFPLCCGPWTLHFSTGLCVLGLGVGASPPQGSRDVVSGWEALHSPAHLLTCAPVHLHSHSAARPDSSPHLQPPSLLAHHTHTSLGSCYLTEPSLACRPASWPSTAYVTICGLA